MIVKFLLLTCCAATLAQGNAHEDALAKELSKGRLNVLKVDDSIRDPRNEYLELIDERKESIEWEHVIQKQNVNRSMTTALFKGMLRNNQFTTFQCIANVIWPTLGKINASEINVQNITEDLLGKALEQVGTLRLITLGLVNYVDDLYAKKMEELKKEENEKGRDMILEYVRVKMRLLGTILAEVENKAKDIKFKFFGSFVSYAHNTEKYLRKTAREGGQKALKCVS